LNGNQITVTTAKLIKEVNQPERNSRIFHWEYVTMKALGVWIDHSFKSAWVLVLAMISSQWIAKESYTIDFELTIGIKNN